GAVETDRLSGMNRIGRAAAGYLALTIVNRDNRRIAILIDADAVRAGSQSVKSQIGRVDFQGLIIIHATNAHVDAAFGQANLNGAIVKIEKREASHRTEPNGVGVDAKFGATIAISPEFVAGGHGPIDDSVNPVIRAGRFE